mmetsp:Transcript_17350/g.45281  ORF Transcript_17350/g.45281 Transcript_17350/m.45281 type:complete len:1034 (+) Transcript_17350:184-3285(+)|eukprot:CAMPEP_0182926694 /NCGR_PEP_ID=MMETSP0105_2-20130417/12213_1 /TAXON_ID=81532 ORGANISM="Acanthoeca-like sp., Strain 10tr" /NCGR_SAMPLE_ID=MMETSP0105_2 /ASSEMBLY_ACC=CAM_ASM_000205 /LENGTH=1033 /DNA_ID=CAMNT_0025064597 /DNA_START=176 /DNA_END=3277 /DNA_ORIENTATION=-
MASHMVVDCLLPTGLMIPVKVTSRRWTLLELKQALWEHAKAMPLFSELKKPELYGLHMVNQAGEIVELSHENQLVMKVDWFQPLIKLFLKKGDKESQRFDLAIGRLINFPLRRFENALDNDDEVGAFRRSIVHVAQKAIRERREGGRNAAILRAYPEEVVDIKADVPEHVKDKLGEKMNVLFKVMFDSENAAWDKTMQASLDESPRELVLRALEKDTRPGQAKRNAEDCIMRVAGRSELLYSRYKIGQYKCVRKALGMLSDRRKILMSLVLVDRSSIEVLDGTTVMEDKLLALPPIQEPPQKLPPVDLFLGLKDNGLEDQEFKIKIKQAFEVPVGNLYAVKVSAAIFQGEQQIGSTRDTRLKIAETENPKWEEDLTFDTLIADLPRDAKLCLAVHGVWINPVKMKKKKKKFRNDEPLVWINVPLFTFRGLLRSGMQTFSTWAYTDDNDDKLFLPHGTTMQNVHGTSRASVLKVDFGQYYRRGVGIKYPELDRLGAVDDGKVPAGAPDPVTAKNLDLVDKIVHKDPLYKLTEEDIKLLRKYKYYQKDEPCALPKVLKAVNWQRQEAASEVVDILRHWAPIGPAEALDLLDSSFADSMTRSHAVKAMRLMTDAQLETVLLQICQVLKYELYLDNDLSKFLLERALRNQRIGHFFFWYLRSEMHLPDAQLRNGLLLEAYCRGCGGHMPVLQAQVEGLDQLVRIACDVKPKTVKKEDRVPVVQEGLKKASLKPFLNPYDPSLVLNPPTCKNVMDSKKLPLWLVFENAKNNEDIHIIFKAGDDLRQDMLTLQLIRVMDGMWVEHGLDLKMSAYECISTGDEVGMLQVVMNSKTIAGIQKKISALRQDDVLFNWLKEETRGEAELTEACDNFLLSCAGYCVATYVLGIGDRHNDNIMMKRTGELFHIDFGHFLGNWKSKFGIKRERVKFILTPDFVYTLCMGEKREKSARWARFKDVCRRAYLIVRARAAFFINLLNMMLSCGIPELQSHDDVAYLRNTLCLDMSEEEAGAEFMREIDQALRDSWSVRVNWAAHIVAHN